MTREKLEHAQRPSVTEIEIGSKCAEKMSIKKLITTYPMLFGALIGLVIFGTIIVIETWFPWIGKAWDRHNRLVQSAWCTAGLFGVCIYQFWDWQRRGRGVFWASMGIFFFLHVLGVFFYSVYVRPILIWQWVILGYLEAYAAAFLVGWSTHRFGHSNRRPHSDTASGIRGGA